MGGSLGGAHAAHPQQFDPSLYSQFSVTQKNAAFSSEAMLYSVDSVFLHSLSRDEYDKLAKKRK